MDRYKILALIGEAGSGKDTLMQSILAKDSSLHEIVSCTTRPPREGEINGKNYYFLTDEEFALKVLNFEMFEATSFRDWFYGTSVDSLDKNKVNIGVFNPDGIYALLESPNVDLIVIRVCANDKIRLMRQLNRENNPDINEIIRRYTTDKEDFYNLDFEHYIVNNETLEDLQDIMFLILHLLEQWG